MSAQSRILNELKGVAHGFHSGDSVLFPPAWRPRQVHGCSVVLTTEADATPPEADAVIAGRHRLRIGVVSADCVPVLLAHPTRPEVGAIHAGWRGFSRGVLERTLERLSFVPGDGWRAAVGPAAGGCCYEVGPDLLEQLLPPPRYMTPSRPGHVRLALRELVADQLRALGFGEVSVEMVGPCTICSNGWPSFRRQGAAAGRIVSWIERLE